MNYTPEKIDKMLSDNYDGDNVNDDIEVYDDYDGDNDDDIEVYEDYDGTDDPDVELFDGTSLKDMRKSTKRFAFHVINSGTEDKTLVLTPGYFNTMRAAAVYDDSGTLKYKLPDGTAVNAPTGYAVGDIVLDFKSIEGIVKAGIQADAVADDGQLIADLQVSSAYKERSIRSFLNYIAKNPTLFASIQISSNNVQIFEQALELRRTTPYAVTGAEIIPFQDGFKPENRNNNKIIVNKEFQFNGETIATLRIPAQTDATLTFVAGAVASRANALKRKHMTSKSGHIHRRFTMGRLFHKHHPKRHMHSVAIRRR